MQGFVSYLMITVVYGNYCIIVLYNVSDIVEVEVKRAMAERPAQALGHKQTNKQTTKQTNKQTNVHLSLPLSLSLSFWLKQTNSSGLSSCSGLSSSQDAGPHVRKGANPSTNPSASKQTNKQTK